MTKMNLKVGIIIPDRGDRPEFLINCWRLLQRQTLKPEIIELVNDKPISDKVDITWRYRNGYERLRNKGLDIIAFMENDDWYSSDYLETMVNAWDAAGRPDLFGTNYTIYYHIGLRAYFTMRHIDRSSAMSTFIKPDLSFPWCDDSEPFTDMWIWTRTNIKNKKTFDPGKHVCLGIKHGVGKFGGGSHVERLERYDPPRGTHDHIGNFLRLTVDHESFVFYKEFKTIKTTTIANNSDFLPSEVDL